MRQSTLHGRHLCLWLVLLAAAILAGYQVISPYEVRLGESDDNSYIDGFYEPESNPHDVYRWSGKTAAVRFPGIGCAQATTLRLRMSGARPSGIPLPQLTLKLNGRRLSRFAAEGQMKIYESTVPRETIVCTGEAEVQIDSETYSPGGGDLRELGVIVDWVMVVPERGGIVLPAPLPMASLLMAATIAFLPLRGRQVPMAVVLSVATCGTVLVGALFAFRRIEAARWSSHLMLMMAIAYLTVLGVDGIRSARRVLGRIRKSTGAILLLALVVHLILLSPRLDEAPNVWTYKNWIWHASIKGLQSLYLEPWALTQPVYPPASLYLLDGVGWLYQSLFGPVSAPVEEPTSELSFLIRLPGVICGLLLALTIFLWLQPRKGYRRAHLAMVVFAFNPPSVLLTTRWGQMDSIHSLFLVLAVICAVSEKPALSWASMTLGACIKPQALLFAPALLVLTWQRSACRGIVQGALAAASIITALMFPFVQSGMWLKIVKYFSSLPAYGAYWVETIHDSHNLWWLVSQGRMVPKTNAPGSLTFAILGSLTYEVIGLSLFGILYLFGLWRLASLRKDGWLWAIVAYIAFAFFMLPTAIHANYLYTAFPLLAMAFFVTDTLPIIYLVLSGTWFLNLVLCNTRESIGGHSVNQVAWYARW